MSGTRAFVFVALDAATENGYTLDGYTDDEVARDLIACDADIEAAGMPAGQVAVHVRAWRDARAEADAARRAVLRKIADVEAAERGRA